MDYNLGKTLSDLHYEHYVIAIFDHQRRLRPNAKIPRERLLKRIKTYKEKIDNVLNTLGVPAIVLVALDNDLCCRPSIGMWTMLCDYVLRKRPVDMAASFYVGSKAGRPRGWNGYWSGESSDTDYKFALNVGLPFRTEYEFYLNKFCPLPDPPFDPRKLASLPPPTFPAAEGPEVVLICGPPCAGKSFFASRVLAPLGYAVLSGSAESVTEKIAATLAAGSSVAVDAPMCTRAAREPLIRAVQSAGGRIRCAVLATAADVCSHLFALRALVYRRKTLSFCKLQRHDESSERYAAGWQEPSADEGFAAVVSVAFGPLFGSPEEREAFCRFMF